MDIQGYNMPEELIYEKNHYWIKKEGDLLVMGMDDFAQKLAGEIVYVQLPDDGKKVKAGKKFAKVESGKWLGKVYSPYADRTFPERPLWGDSHLHTSLSMDAGGFGNRC